jgi:hypothetical protein
VSDDNLGTVREWMERGLCQRSAEAMLRVGTSRTVCSGFSGPREPLLWEENFSNNSMGYEDRPDWDTLYAVDRYTERQLRGQK